MLLLVMVVLLSVPLAVVAGRAICAGPDTAPRRAPDTIYVEDDLRIAA